jgi:hypothetical protein
MAEKKSDPESALWMSAYDRLKKENHYHKGEGPIPALARLQKEGLIDMSVDAIKKEGHEKVKKELGPHGSLGGRNVYHSTDSVLSEPEQKAEVKRLFEKAEKHEKLVQDERLTSSTEAIKRALTPDLQDALKKSNLKIDPEKIHKGMEDALKHDSIPLPALQKRADGDFPIMDGYVGVGAITTQQRDQILAEQKQDRMQWRAAHPDAAKGEEFKQFQSGDLLRQHFGKEKIDAADALLKKLQPEHH